MKSFLDNRPVIGSAPSFKGGGAEAAFQKLNPGGAPVSTSAKETLLEEVANPGGPDAPKVEFVREGDMVKRIVVRFGEQKVEIDCQY